MIFYEKFGKTTFCELPTDQYHTNESELRIRVGE